MTMSIAVSCTVEAESTNAADPKTVTTPVVVVTPPVVVGRSGASVVAPRRSASLVWDTVWWAVDVEFKLMVGLCWVCVC